MVALAVVAGGFLLAPARGSTDEVPPGLDRQRRHARSGKREVVRPVERAAHVGLVHHRQRFGTSGLLERGAQGRPVQAQGVDVARAPRTLATSRFSTAAVWSSGTSGSR